MVVVESASFLRPLFGFTFAFFLLCLGGVTFGVDAFADDALPVLFFVGVCTSDFEHVFRLRRFSQLIIAAILRLSETLIPVGSGSSGECALAALTFGPRFDPANGFDALVDVSVVTLPPLERRLDDVNIMLFGCIGLNIGTEGPRSFG